MSIQSVRPVGVGIPTPATTPAAPAPAVATRPTSQVRKVRSSEDQNVFNPPGVISRLVRSMRADFDRLVALGTRIGIDRSHPVLAGRLQALEMAERRNEEAARQGADQIRAEMEGLSTGQRRLRSLKYAYADEEDHRPPIAEG